MAWGFFLSNETVSFGTMGSGVGTIYMLERARTRALHTQHHHVKPIPIE